jgi:8-oxo-dGTP diphosphatase
MHLFHTDDFSGDLVSECDEGNLEWVDKNIITTLQLWEGDKIFLDLLEKDVPFFSLKLVYEGSTLVSHILEF